MSDPMTTSESAPDPTAGEWPGESTPAEDAAVACALASTPDADDVGEPLTEAERRRLRDALVAAWRDDYSVQTVVDGLAAAIERIKAAAATKARADERERIEALVCTCAPEFRDFHGKHHADCPVARIARDGAA